MLVGPGSLVHQQLLLQMSWGFASLSNWQALLLLHVSGPLLVALPVALVALPFALQVGALPALCGQGLSCEHF